MHAKAFGYAKKIASDTPLEMKEVTFVGSPTELRRIAAFLVKSAGEIEKHGVQFGHSHLRDEGDLHPWRSEAVDVIVAGDSKP